MGHLQHVGDATVISHRYAHNGSLDHGLMMPALQGSGLLCLSRLFINVITNALIIDANPPGIHRAATKCL